MILSQYPEIVFATSKANDGNMSFYHGSKDEIIKNRSQFFNSLNIDPKKVIEVEQKHTNKTISVDKDSIGKPLVEADGMITNSANLFLIVKTADCHAVALYDLKTSAIGLVHAGRLGLEKGVLKKAVEKMHKEFGTNPKDLVAQFAPSIGPCCYKPVIIETTSQETKKHLKEVAGMLGIDIWSWVQEQLIESGVLNNNIDNPKICTYHSNKYFSHKKYLDGNQQEDGRIITTLGIR